MEVPSGVVRLAWQPGLLLLVIGCSETDPQPVEPVYLDSPVESALRAVSNKYIAGESGVLLSGGAVIEGLPALTLHGVLDCPISSCPDYAVGEQGLALTRDPDTDTWTVLELGLSPGLALFDIGRYEGDVVVVGDTVRVWDEWEGPSAGFDPAPPDAAGWGRLHDYLALRAVGEAGTIVSTPDLHVWTRESSGTSEDLLALGFSDDNPNDFDPGELWAVGRAGTVLAEREGEWVALDLGIEVDLLDFAGGYAITGERELLALHPDETHALVARFDHRPLALAVSRFERVVVTVVGEGGMIAELDLGSAL